LIPGRGWEFFSSPPRPDRFWGPSSFPSNGCQGSFPVGETDHSSPSSAEVKNAWSYNSTPQYAFMVLCSVEAKHKDKFALLYFADPEYIKLSRYHLSVSFRRCVCVDVITGLSHISYA
jgi:hypothetical protein